MRTAFGVIYAYPLGDTRSAPTRFARPRSGHFFRCTRHFGPDADRFSRDLRVLVVLKRASRAPDPDTFFAARFNGMWASIQDGTPAKSGGPLRYDYSFRQL